ncbi:MAG: hypothetical protein J3R72DRAFT_431595 [Linnemannia gamsii]|nr:MAG: hypothetical protein J3R72DRAFT_431595 [Linnemannia gamsii]
MDMISSGRSRLHDGARYAAGSFMNPLTNAIGEQRRLVDSLSAVSKARVEECKHMMAWSKSQTDDLGDVLLKLNLLIRKISDYELRFGSQYEEFREKIKYLRTKDDTLCEMGRFQNDISTKLVEKGKSGLRAWIKKDTDEDSSKKEPEPDIKLVQLKRQLIKVAYAQQLDAVIELGKKMQIIGEHGKHLLEHIDQSGSVSPYTDGRDTELVLQAARIALENWSQGTTVDTQDTLVNPSPAPTPKPTPSVSVSDASAAADANAAAKKSVARSPSPSPSPPAKPATKVESAAAVPPLPPRTPDKMPSSESLVPRRVQKNRARAAEEDLLTQQEELELKKALALSLESSPVRGKDVSDLELSAEEMRFISEQANLAVPKPAGVSRTVRSPQSVEIGGHVPSQRRPTPSQTAEDDKEVTKAVPAPALEELGGSRSSSEYMDSQRISSASRKSAHATKPAPMESMGPEPESLLESMGCDSAPAYESMGDSGMTPAAHENLRLQTVLSHRKLQELQQPSPFPPSPELQYLQVQHSPQQQKLQISQTAQGNLHLSTPMNSNHSSPMGGSYHPNVAYKPATTYVPHSNKPRNRNSGPITPPTSEGLSPSASQLLQQRQRQQEFQQQLQGEEGRPISLTAKHSLQQQQELQKRLQEFYYTTNEQENTERFHQEHSSNHSEQRAGHRQQPSGSWDYHPEDSDGDYQYKEEYHTLHR